jgi:hypothetical protein
MKTDSLDARTPIRVRGFGSLPSGGPSPDYAGIFLVGFHSGIRFIRNLRFKLDPEVKNNYKEPCFVLRFLKQKRNRISETVSNHNVQ